MYLNDRLLSICPMSYRMPLANAIIPMRERIVPISNEETFIEFRVALIAADTSRGNINLAWHTVHTSARRIDQNPRV